MVTFARSSNSFINGIHLKTTIAKLISTLGHPFLTVPIFVVFLLFSIESARQATYLSLLIIGGIFVPIGIATLRGVRKGTYTNLDVSDQTQRQKWFITTTLLLFVVTLIIWLTHQERTLRLAVMCALILLITAQVVNTRVKASMHLAFHVFLGFLIFHFNGIAGSAFLLFAPLLAWSRIQLKRHVWKEIVVGVILGAILGATFWLLN
ncbi:hypothetical protein SAMN05444682_11230 [Parapedobacter indicus]|uniref:PAP2 superfamily protein n=1 Tax=Parapedobacter indicus TaxID=1477437 RepID=A0A1I3T5M7_9SPHI|nr:hypothetical protein CLV26_112151 [Parapedobacter indicus]SFJ65930.1 hypothetical protein SAMN05444682_11230 [Parapedobacter indicus]